MGGKMKHPHYDLKSTIFMGGQNPNPYVIRGTFFMQFDDLVKSIQRIIYIN
jgi:hypothetical protein